MATVTGPAGAFFYQLGFKESIVYVISGKVPFLLGRLLVEKLKVSIDYADKMIKWGSGEWRPVPLDPKGEYVLHLRPRS